MSKNDNIYQLVEVSKWKTLEGNKRNKIQKILIMIFLLVQ